MVFVSLSSSGCTKKKPADKVAPMAPVGISITAVSSSEIKVSWKPSTDDSGKIKVYKVYRNGQYLADTDATSASDKTLTPKVKFCYRISAVDEAGNESIQSTEVCAML
jgi:chitodextrinase